MKRLLILLVYLAIPCQVLALGSQQNFSVVCSDIAPTGFDLYQNFEGTGYDNGETWAFSCAGGTCSADSTSSPLRWAQSALMTPTSADVYITSPTITDRASERFSFSVEIEDLSPAADSRLVWVRNGSTNLFFVRVLTTGVLQLLDGDAATARGSTVGTLTAGKNYIWISYTKGTGANAVYSVGHSTTRYEPISGDNFVSTSAGAATADVNNIIIYADYTNTGAVKVDQVLARPTKIGTVCR